MQYISAVSKVRGWFFPSASLVFFSVLTPFLGRNVVTIHWGEAPIITSKWQPPHGWKKSQSSWKRSKSCGLSSLHSWQIFHMLHPCHAGKLWLVKSSKPSIGTWSKDYPTFHLTSRNPLPCFPLTVPKDSDFHWTTATEAAKSLAGLLGGDKTFSIHPFRIVFQIVFTNYLVAYLKYQHFFQFEVLS